MNPSHLIAALIAQTQAQVPLPSPDPLGYPVPAILLQILSYFTLGLHFIAVNFTLGGLIYLVWTKIRKVDNGASEFLSSSLPLGFSYLVTLGIPPLLFVQVMYGQMFYSSSVIIGAFWILVVPLLILAYGMLYLNKLKKDTRPNTRLVILGISLLAMLTIGFIYVNNLTLSMTPGMWMEKYTANPAGSQLNHGEPTLFARYALFMSPALVVAGAALVLVGILRSKWRGDDAGVPIHELGMKGHLIGRVATLAAAGALISTLPKEFLDTLMAGPGKLFLIFGVGLAALSTAMVVVAAQKKGTVFGIIGIVLMVLEVIMFIAVRDFLRQIYLAEFFKFEDVPVHEQWGMVGIFVASMVAGLALLIVLTVKVSKSAIARYKESHAA
ncbi:MAG: hypothetical protein JXX14_21645 [Deltaproteobacteria bacterium]|nr:hypothetical protein [Deltaproteobacteria bacterium]